MNTPAFNLSPVNDLLSRSIKHLQKLIDRKKTLCEVLEDNLTDEEFQNIGKYITIAEASKECTSILAALSTFNWSATEEGRAYWGKVYSRFENVQL